MSPVASQALGSALGSRVLSNTEPQFQYRVILAVLDGALRPLEEV